MSRSCVRCGSSETTRRCELCTSLSAVYCSAEHQVGDWLLRHKDECSYLKAGLGACVLTSPEAIMCGRPAYLG